MKVARDHALRHCHRHRRRQRQYSQAIKLLRDLAPFIAAVAALVAALSNGTLR
ncbi:hypothetical protein GCM10010124_10430 [Pilimelia terevasa]|uniref:Uncharacterized protein n=1 Tax=Pilimelia terevasa TaxID=53372 RepID=A0A8J3BJW8_9ACTN|nr:hypothetical protein GCM10010124_10430 [Pilimelia terevasa]